MIETNGLQLSLRIKVYQQTTKLFKFYFEETLLCFENRFDLRLKCSNDREKLLKIKGREFANLLRSLKVLNRKKKYFLFV